MAQKDDDGNASAAEVKKQSGLWRCSGGRAHNSTAAAALRGREEEKNSPARPAENARALSTSLAPQSFLRLSVTVRWRRRPKMVAACGTDSKQGGGGD